MHRIWTIAKDIGGFNGMKPLVEKLRLAGEEITFFVTGKAAEMVHGHEEFISTETVKDIFRGRELPDILLTSMDSVGGGGRDLVPILRREGVTTLAVQDFWGIRAEWRNQKYWTDWVLVGDRIGKQLTVDSWTGYNPDHVIITGYPAFDKYAGYDVKAAKEQLRESLNVLEEMPIVLAGIDDLPGSGAMCRDIVEALNAICREVCLIVRPHPALKDRSPDEVQIFKAALEEFDAGVLIRDTGDLDLSKIIAGSTVTLAMFSTILVEAACLYRQAIAILYPETGAAHFQAQTGIDEFPLVGLGCAKKAENFEELRRLLKQSLNQGLGLKEMQAKELKLDGCSAQRAASFIASLET